MTYLVFGAVLAAMLSVPFVAMSSNEALAQQRATCSQARSHCGTQRVCQRRYDACWLLEGRAYKKMRIREGISGQPRHFPFWTPRAKRLFWKSEANARAASRRRCLVHSQKKFSEFCGNSREVPTRSRLEGPRLLTAPSPTQRAWKINARPGAI